MSKLKEQIIKSINLQNGTFIDKDSTVQPFQPRNAYLLPKEDGTHERWVTDDNVAISKQAGSGSINQLIEVTYDELLNLKNTSTLIKGQNYLLTDYETTYIQPITNVNKNSGVIEPLIITATDVNKLHNQCKSTLYPQDIVYYEITGDIGNNYGTEGFTKGKIYRRIDTLRNNDIGTDWRHVKYDRSGVDKLLFENYSNCYNNVIKTYYLFNNVLGYGFHNNTMGNSFYSNTIGNRFSYNTIGESFQDNTIGDSFNFNGNSTTPFLSQNTEFRNNIGSVTSTIEIKNPNIDVVVFKSPNGTKKQRYYDNSNNLVINNL